MPNKDLNRTPAVESKAVVPPVPHVAAAKTTTNTVKVVSKQCVKDTVMSPVTSPSIDAERTELLGSLTTEQQQRTSARVIKKLRLEPPGVGEKRPLKKDGVDELQECDTPNKLDEKELKFPTVKQRMPKALWSTDEKNLFFEALNEYGKDFDAITAYICAKMKKKGVSDNLKAKTQVSHFYYRTWHKLSKHVHFDENVKKVAQELYALINYGELRKKLVAVSEKTCSRLSEMVLCGSIVVRARGRNVRVRTPMCRALRRLNQITEARVGTRVCSRATAVLRARDGAAWARVLRAAHNPRAAVTLPLRTSLAALLHALQSRWTPVSRKFGQLSENTNNVEDLQNEPEDNAEISPQLCEERELKTEVEEHVSPEIDRTVMEDHSSSKRLALHLGPRADAQIHLAVVRPSEQLSSQKICFSSYLERMGSQRDKDGSAKIRTPKRTRKDSATDKDKEDIKKTKLEDSERLINIDETAIDGIELMASYKSQQEDEEKPSTEDEKERDLIEDDGDRDIERDKDISERDKDMSERDKDMSERDKDMSEREKDSFSEMEDDEKYNKSDTDNESDHGKEKSGKESQFKNLKVKFRIRPKKRGGSIYTLVMDNPEEVKTEDSKTEEPAKEDEAKPDIDVELALRQIRRGWSVGDAGELTVGDLYLMFGSRSKLELDYWWAEPNPPLPQPQKTSPLPEKDKNVDKQKDKVDKSPDKLPDKVSDCVKSDKVSDKGTDSSLEDDKGARESDNDILSPKNTYSQDSNDGMSGDERKGEQLTSPDHKSVSSSSGALKLVSKLVNRPSGPAPPNGFHLMSDRLRRLLALAGNPHVSAAPARCCGHVCAPKKQVRPECPESVHVFRQPPPIAPRPQPELQVSKTGMRLEGIPRWRRGRPRAAERRVVVQRLLPLLPKLPAPPKPAPTKLSPESPPTPVPRILPKPPLYTSDLSLFYVVSESGGQVYLHDGDRSIAVAASANGGQYHADGCNEAESNGVKLEENSGQADAADVKDAKLEVDADADADVNANASADANTEREQKTEPEEVDATPEFLAMESMSLSPSRLLHDAGWFDGAGQDFSLSSFLGHLEGRPQPDAVETVVQSLLAESSVDYVAKFADLAAEVAAERDGTDPA